MIKLTLFLKAGLYQIIWFNLNLIGNRLKMLLFRDFFRQKVAITFGNMV